MVLNASGRLGLGTLNPTSRFTIVGEGVAGSGAANKAEIMNFISNSAAYQSRVAFDDNGTLASASGYDFNAGDGQNGLLIESVTGEGSGFYSDGDTQILYNAGDNDRLLSVLDEDGMTEEWYLDGNGNAFSVSDQNKKEAFIKVENAVESLKQVSGYSYIFSLHPEEIAKGAAINPRRYGVKAQEIEAVFPHAVSTDDEGNKFMNYAGMTAIFIEAIKEQEDTIETLKAANAELEARLTTETNELKDRLATLEAAVQLIAKK